MKKTIILFLLLSSCSSVTVEEELFVESPEIYINCNFIDAPDDVKINVDISVFSNSEKLINGSIKGSGVAENFTKSLDDIEKNSSFSAEYVFTTKKNGTFSFILNYDGIKSYRVDCSDKISSIITETTLSIQNETTTTTVESNQTTTTSKPKQTTTTTTTTTTTLPYVDYKQYDLDALRLFLEVGFFYEDKVWRFEPENFSTVKIYSSPNANSDDGLDNLLKTIPYKYSQLDIPLVFEYVDNQDYKEGSAEFWYTSDGYTHPELLNGFPEGTSCGGNTGYFYDFSYNFDEYRITSIQVNICISGNGFQQKQAFIQDGLMNALGFNRVQTGSEFEYYGGYLQPQYIKYKENFNELDKQLIQILYDPRVFRGMNKEQFKDVFQLP